MNSLLYEFFEKDHRRLDALLNKATENPGEIKMEHYQKFRTGLLTHIKMEEKILFPAAQKANDGVPLPVTQQLRLDHGALTALMAIDPSLAMMKVLHYILEKHDLAEEEPGGMYDLCAALTQDQTQVLLDQLAKISEVPVHPPNSSSFVFEACKRALLRAGYDFDTLSK
jgi:hemerythrin superfamily protein